MRKMIPMRRTVCTANAAIAALATRSGVAMAVAMSVAVAVLGGAAALPATAFAQDKTVKILVGFPPGAGLDAMTRMVAEKMRATLGQNVIVENRPGAGGRIAMDALKVAPADGSVLVMTPLVTVVTAPHVYPDLGYDAFKDFAPVAHAADFLFAYAASSQVPANSLQGVRAGREGGSGAAQLCVGGTRQPAAFLFDHVR